VVIRYSVRNGSSEDIGLFNRITNVRADGTLEDSPDIAYVELDGERLLVRKLALPLPQNVRMAAYVPPYASKLAAGEVFTEEIELALPVRVMQPFKRVALPGQVVADKPAVATSVRFEIGYFPISAGLQLVPSNPAHPTLLSPMPPGPAVSQQRVVAQDFELPGPLSVLDYRAVPWR
jgi:hypothetical protein